VLEAEGDGNRWCLRECLQFLKLLVSRSSVRQHRLPPRIHHCLRNEYIRRVLVYSQHWRGVPHVVRLVADAALSVIVHAKGVRVAGGTGGEGQAGGGGEEGGCSDCEGGGWGGDRGRLAANLV